MTTPITLAYTIDPLTAEISHQRHHSAWADSRRFVGDTRWEGAPLPTPPDPGAPPPPPNGLWILPRHMTRAHHRLLSPRPLTLAPDARWTWTPSTEALLLGLVVQWDRAAGLIYMTAPHDVYIPPDTCLIRAEVVRPMAGRIRSAVAALRRMGMPQTAEDLLQARTRLSDTIADVQIQVSAAADREAHTGSHTLETWADLGRIVGELDE